MSSKTQTLKIPTTSHSLTSIKVPPNNKIDQIIVRLQTRKKQLVRTIAQENQRKGKLIYCENGQQKSRELLQCKQNKEQSQIDLVKQRKAKYQNKIENQIQQYDKLQSQSKAVDQKMMQCVIQIEEQEIKLKKISDEVGNQYRQAFGLSSPNCLNSSKWILLKIQELETVLEGSDYSLRGVLCKFYDRTTNQNVKTQQKEVPLEPLVYYMAKHKLVNKLYGYILQQELFKKAKRQPQTVTEALQQTEQNQSLQQQASSGQEQQEDEQNHKRWHETWLTILKHMKTLQKMHNSVADTNSDRSQSGKQFAISDFKNKVNQWLQKALSTKKNIKDLKQKIQGYRNAKQEIDQQMTIKQELIEQLKNKVKKLSQKIIKSNGQNQGKNVAQKPKMDYEKELREIDQAIKYFNIKKSTSGHPTQPKQNHNYTATAQLKSVEDISTTFLSPLKSCVSFDRLPSPDMFMTKNRNSRNKYSLKQLLSPPKYLNTEKKKAWK